MVLALRAVFIFPLANLISGMALTKVFYESEQCDVYNRTLEDDAPCGVILGSMRKEVEELRRAISNRKRKGESVPLDLPMKVRCLNSMIEMAHEYAGWVRVGRGIEVGELMARNSHMKKPSERGLFDMSQFLVRVDDESDKEDELELSSGEESFSPLTQALERGLVVESGSGSGSGVDDDGDHLSGPVYVGDDVELDGSHCGELEVDEEEEAVDGVEEEEDDYPEESGEPVESDEYDVCDSFLGGKREIDGDASEQEEEECEKTQEIDREKRCVRFRLDKVRDGSDDEFGDEWAELEVGRVKRFRTRRLFCHGDDFGEETEMEKKWELVQSPGLSPILSTYVSPPPRRRSLSPPFGRDDGELIVLSD